MSWQARPLGELIENRDTLRVPVKEADRRAGPYPYYGASGIVDHVDGYIYEGEHLLVAEDGENLRTRATPIAFRATGRFWVNNHAHVVRARNGNSTRFLEYALRVAEVDAFLTGAVMPKLTQANLHRVPVIVPPPSEQRAIARILGALDDKIELNRRTNETLEAMARAIFQSWFVDFDPVRAKMEGRRPEGMDAETAKLFPNSFASAGTSPVPQGWRVRTLADAVALGIGGELQTGPFGSQLHASDYVDDGIPSVMPKDIVGTRISEASIARVRESDAERLSQHRLRAGDLVFSRRGDVEKHALAREQEEGWLCGTGCLRVRLGQGGVPAAYASSLLATDDAKSWLTRHAVGLTMPNINTGVLGAVPFLIPIKETMDAYANIVTSFDACATTRSCEIARLAELRDTLLPKLLSGELRIVDAERAASRML